MQAAARVEVLSSYRPCHPGAGQQALIKAVFCCKLVELGAPTRQALGHKERSALCPNEGALHTVLPTWP